jgi:hypothetical protein
VAISVSSSGLRASGSRSGRWRAASRSSILRSASPGEQPAGAGPARVPGADEALDLLVVEVGQGVDALRRVGAAGPGVRPRGEHEAACLPGAAHQLVDGAEHALRDWRVAALVEAIERISAPCLRAMRCTYFMVSGDRP